jgi:RHS repeat-associated protein
LTGYDNNSNVVSTADPLGGTTTYSYDDNGRPSATTVPAGGTSSVEYDLGGNVTKSTSATGGITTYTYNDDGKVATMVDPRGNAAGANPADYTVTYGYDPAGNLTTLTDQLGKVTRYAFDSNNRVTAGTDPNGHTTTYKFLDDDTLQSVVGPDGQTATTYSYDNAGNVVSRTDAVGNTRFTYDKLGRMTDMKDPLNQHTLFSFDADGNQTQSVAPGDTDPSTRTIAYSYDILDRLTTQNQANGALVYNWGYDANNQITSMADPTGVRTQTYDNSGRLSSVSRGSQTFSYGYDGDGNVTSRTWPDGTSLSYTFDGNDNVSSLTVQGGQTGPNAAHYTFGYDPSGRLNRTTYPTADHMVTDRAYDRAGRLSDLNSHSDGGTVARYQVSRDPVGNPTGITTSRGSNSQHVAYTYDVSDRVTAACVGADCATATGKTAYTYDGVGNRLSQTLTGTAGNTTTSYVYNSASELTNSTVTGPSGGSSTTYAYDRSGDLVQAGASTYTYNLDHTLASASINGTTTSYGYDAQGIELAATSNSAAGSQTRTWQDDVNNSLPMLAEQTTTNAVSTTTQGFLDNPTDGSALGMLTGGQTDSYAPDTLHGVANVVDPAGNTLAAYDYDPFGKPRTDGTASGVASSVSNPIGFAGGYQDSTLGGQISTLARVYDQNTGRFDSVDPVASAQRQPAVSPYAYVGDRSTSFYDPSGAAPCSSNDDHDQAQMFALDLFRLQYGPFNVYGDCPGYRIWRGVPGRISLRTTVPASNPDILVNAANNTLLYEVKPMANQLGQICRTCGQRGDNNAYQVQRYLWALAYDTTGRFPNPQPGPNIAPATRPTPDGGQITIFSGVDWNKYAPPSARPDIRNAGIIYYVKTKPPRNPTPPPVVQKSPGGKETEEPKQDPRQIPTTAPADNGAEQVLEKVLVTLLEIILIALLIALLALVVIAVASIFAPVLLLFA